MKASEVKPGVVYGYSTWRDPRSVEKVVFLTEANKDNLYQTSRRGSGFIKESYRKAPKVGRGYWESGCGYLVAKGADPSRGTLEEALRFGRQMVETNGEYDPVPFGERDYEYAIVEAMSYIHGEYESWVATKEYTETVERLAREEQARADKKIADAWRKLMPQINAVTSEGKAELFRGNYKWSGKSEYPTSIHLDYEAASQLVRYIIEVESRES